METGQVTPKYKIVKLTKFDSKISRPLFNNNP